MHDRKHGSIGNSAPGDDTSTWSSKLQQHHFERSAVVYVRQSTQTQVLIHRESAARRNPLVDPAVQHGRPSERVEVIDENEGQNGSTIDGRKGLTRLLAEVSLDHVGVILGIELSRLLQQPVAKAVQPVAALRVVNVMSLNSCLFPRSLLLDSIALSTCPSAT